MACAHCGRELTPTTATHCPSCGGPAPSATVPLAFLAMLRECRAAPLTVRFLVRKNLKSYAAFGLVFGAMGMGCVLIDMPSLAAALAGVWYGVIVRDVGTFRKVVGSWPYQVAVLDWELIDRLAAGEQSSNEPGLKT